VYIGDVNIIHMDIVNMTETEPPYHHGDLRAELIQRAINQIEQGGAAKISLRKLAADAGVSHNAPYMHFSNKDALMEAVAAEGFALLRAAIAEAGGMQTLQAENWRARVKTGFTAYLHFARTWPRLYALMHQPQGGSEAQETGGAKAGEATLTRLAQTLATGQRLGLVRANDPNRQALWVWTTLHGLAGLTGDTRRSFGVLSPDEVADAVLDQLLQGLAPPVEA
jgi:AcrR family transcriptional regulator